MVVTLSPFKANMEFSDVLLPIAPFTETSGSFINAEGRLQSFHAVVRPLGDTRPAWKVLRVLANMLEIPGFDFETSQDVLVRATNAAPGAFSQIDATQLSNAVTGGVTASVSGAAGEPVVASIYQLDGLVRRSPSLQLTADARMAREGGGSMIDALYNAGLGLLPFGWWTAAAWPVLWILLKIVCILAPLMGAVAYLTLWERKLLGFHAGAPWPQPCRTVGLLQPIADALKLMTKEIIQPTAASKGCSVLGPVMAIMPALAAWVAIPFGPMWRWPTSMRVCCW
jgi:hypothetical protein